MFIFPTHKLNPASVRAEPRATVISGGQSLSGIDTVIQTDGGGRWEVAYSGIELYTPELQRLWSQWASYLAGGSRVILVPLVSIRTSPRPYGGGGSMRVSQMYADDPKFPTAVRYASPYIVANVVSNAAMRATTLVINVTKGARIEGGEKFSIGQRAYVIERVVSSSGQVATCIISPPLRDAVSANAPVNFEWPVVRCRATMGQDLSPDYLSGKYGTIAISFTEDFSDD